VPFQKEGAPCVAMVQAELMNSAIPDALKCADIIRQNGQVVATDGPWYFDGMTGPSYFSTGPSCFNGACHACRYDTPVDKVLCVVGVGNPRVCEKGDFVDSN